MSAHAKRRDAWTAHVRTCATCAEARFSADQATQAAALCDDGATLWLSYEETRIAILDAARAATPMPPGPSDAPTIMPIGATVVVPVGFVLRLHGTDHPAGSQVDVEAGDPLVFVPDRLAELDRTIAALLIRAKQGPGTAVHDRMAARRLLGRLREERMLLLVLRDTQASSVGTTVEE